MAQVNKLICFSFLAALSSLNVEHAACASLRSRLLPLLKNEPSARNSHANGGIPVRLLLRNTLDETRNDEAGSDRRPNNLTSRRRRYADRIWTAHISASMDRLRNRQVLAMLSEQFIHQEQRLSFRRCKKHRGNVQECLQLVEIPV